MGARSPHEADAKTSRSDPIEDTYAHANSIAPYKLARLIGACGRPTLIEVRYNAAFAADACLVPDAMRRSAADIVDWGETSGARR